MSAAMRRKTAAKAEVAAVRAKSGANAKPKRARAKAGARAVARPAPATELTPHDLMALAVHARAASHSPYSRFAVGAALLTHSGRVFLGCNVENASYGLTCCAERTAVFKAVSEGERRFAAIAVTAREGQGAPPCGACRQVMAEFAPDLLVYWRDRGGRMRHKSLQSLLPDQFEFVKRGGKPR